MRSPTFPLGVAASGRHLEDAAAVPFRVNTDAAWFAPTEFWLEDSSSAATFEEYLTDRSAKGFTSFLMMGMVQSGYNNFLHFPRDAYTHLPHNRISGEPPLLVPGDFATPNPTYWKNVRAIVAAAERHGLLVTLAYAYLGYAGGNQGWWDAICSPPNTRAVMHDFGVFVARLLAPHPNVLWYPYGDFNPPPGEGSAKVRASIEGIRTVAPEALFAAELAPPDNLVSDHPDADELLQVNTFYGYGPDGDGRVEVTAHNAWQARPTRPAWVCEPEYEGADIGGDGTAEAVRRAEWSAVLGGGTAGQVYGAIGVYSFAPRTAEDGTPGWRTALDLPGAIHQAHQFAFWSTLDWWSFVPSGAGDDLYGIDLVVAGQGHGLDRISAAGTLDGRWVVAYVPVLGSRTFAIDANRMRGPVVATWLDATSGRRSPEPPAPAGVLDFRVPGSNSTGASDWVLLLTAQ